MNFDDLVADVTQHQRVEEALRESEEKFRVIIEYANVGIAVVQDVRFRFVNPHYAAVLGYVVEGLLGTEFMGYRAAEERERIVDLYTRRVRGEPVPPVGLSVVLPVLIVVAVAFFLCFVYFA